MPCRRPRAPSHERSRAQRGRRRARARPDGRASPRTGRDGAASTHRATGSGPSRGPPPIRRASSASPPAARARRLRRSSSRRTGRLPPAPCRAPADGRAHRGAQASRTRPSGRGRSRPRRDARLRAGCARRERRGRRATARQCRCGRGRPAARGLGERGRAPARATMPSRANATRCARSPPASLQSAIRDGARSRCAGRPQHRIAESCGEGHNGHARAHEPTCERRRDRGPAACALRRAVRPVRRRRSGSHSPP